MTVGLLAAAYGVNENQATEKSNARQKELVELMSNAADEIEFNRLDQARQKEEDAAAQHKVNSDVGTTAAAILLGLATWVLFNPPDTSTTAISPSPFLYANNDSWRAGVILRW